MDSPTMPDDLPADISSTLAALSRQHDDEAVRDALAEMVADSMRAVTGGLALLFAVFAVSHLIFLAPPLAFLMSGVAAVTAVLYGGIYAWLGRHRVPRPAAHLSAALLAAPVLLNSLLHLV